MITLTRLVTTAALVTTIACAVCSKTQPRAQADACACGFRDGKGRSKNHADSLPRDRDQGG